MANAVFNSEENYFNNNFIRPNVPRSAFDLSYIHTTDADFGVLLPIYLEETLPNDDFTISAIIRATSLPLQSPLYSNIRIRTAFFYVPYYLMWHKFDRFMTGGRDGTMSIPLPKAIGNATVTPRSLGDYLGFPIGLPYKDVSIFPLFAYQRIYRDYFLDQDNQTSTNVNLWFPLDEFDFSLDNSDLTYLSDSVSPNHLKLDLIRPCNWRKDYFTSSMFSPQRGDPVAMPITGTAPLNFTNTVNTNFDYGAQQTWDMQVVYDKNAPESTALSAITASPHSNKVKDALQRGYADLTSSKIGFTIDDLRFATQLQEWLERNMRTKAEYGSFLRVHFNDAPLDERLTKPYYIGGSSQSFSVSEILQTSETTSASAQGTARGHGSSFDKQFIGKFHSHEYGLIMGLLYIMPDTTYSNGLDRHWTKESKFDFYFPEFCDIGPQAIHNEEIYYTGNDIDKQVLGYVGRFDEYRHHRNHVSGSLRDPNNADFYSWTLAREFASTPTLNSWSFTSGLKVDGVVNIPSDQTTIRHDPWLTNTTVNPFILQCGFEVRAVRPLPYVNVPKGLL